jgi:hypothetical protein
MEDRDGSHLSLERPPDAPHTEPCEPHTPHSGGDGTEDGIFDWGWENEDIVVAGSPALAIYVTNARQIAIRGDATFDPRFASDPIIFINPRDVDLICQRLREVADELLGSGGQGPVKERR